MSHPTGDDTRSTQSLLAELDSLPALISVPHAARLLGLARASAYRYAAAGELPVKRMGGRVYVITAKIRPIIDGSEVHAA